MRCPSKADELLAELYDLVRDQIEVPGKHLSRNVRLQLWADKYRAYQREKTDALP